jgi:hypothetical protein
MNTPTDVASVIWWRSPSELTSAAPTAVTAFVKSRGLAWQDISPVIASVAIRQQIQAAARATIGRGIAAYESLQFADAVAILDESLRLIDSVAAQGLSTAELSDAFLYRALARSQEPGQNPWDDFVTAAVLGSSRILDSARFAPSAVEQFARARAAVAQQAESQITLSAAPQCNLAWDGAMLAMNQGQITLQIRAKRGVHWLSAQCPGRVDIAQRVQVSDDQQNVIAAGNVFGVPTEQELRVAAQVVAPRGYVVVVVLGSIATLRKFDARGQLQGTQTVAIGSANDERLIVEALQRLLGSPIAASSAPTERWFQKRWVWATGGALLASVILVPFALSNNVNTSATVRVAVPDSWR